MSLLVTSLLVSFVCLLIRPCFVYGTSCLDSYSCQDDTITDAAYCYGYFACYDATIDGTSAYCSGYFGCFSADELTTSGLIACYGGYGCYYAASFTAGSSAYCDGFRGCYNIQSTLSITNSIYCDGDYGCAYNDDGNGIVTYSGSIYCNGNYACYYSVLDSADDIYCDGDLSCRSAEMDSEDNIYCYGNLGCYSATMEAADYIYSYGRYGAYYSSISNTERIYGFGFFSNGYGDISSSGVDSLSVYLYGYLSGYGLDITCESGSSCYIYCNGYGCYNTDVTCNGDCTISCDEDCDYCATESTFYDNDIWDNYQKEKKLLKESIENKILQSENEYVGAGGSNDDKRNSMIEEYGNDKDNTLLLKEIEEMDRLYDAKRNEFYDMDNNNNNGISKYMKELDDEFIKLRHKYGLDKNNDNNNKNSKQELIVNNVNKDNSLKSNSLYYNMTIGITCLAIVSLVMNMYQCYINHKNSKDSKYINIV